jgi:hypothetical protein
VSEENQQIYYCHGDHLGSVDARGNLVYDPLGYDSFQGEIVDEIRAFRFEEN